MTIDDPGEDVGQVHERVDIVQLTVPDQQGDGGPVFGAERKPGVAALGQLTVAGIAIDLQNSLEAL